MTSFDAIVSALSERNHFLILTHEDPDADGIGSMLALGRSLSAAGKEVTLLTQEPIHPPLRSLTGADQVVNELAPDSRFEIAVALDCAERTRLGRVGNQLKDHDLLINIDHHETNSAFGTLNLIEPTCSSTAELVFRVIQAAGLPISPDVAGNLFAGIQADTGSFRYSNTTPGAFRAAADLLEQGADPWDISRRVMDSYSLPRLRLLRMALDTVRFHYAGQIAVMTLTRRMFQESGAQAADTERFVDYPRFVEGVELGVLVRELGERECKFSLRSNKRLNAARLAADFGGGGHVRAAGFRCQRPVDDAISEFLIRAEGFLDETGDRWDTPDR